MRQLLLFCGLALAGLPTLPSAAQVLDASFVAPTSFYSTSDVLALGPAQADGKRLVSGNFTRINGTAVSSQLVRLDASGALDQTFLQNVGTAYAPYRIRGLANGQYLLGQQGGSIVAGGLTRTELLRLNANGTADASFDAGTGTVFGNYSNDFVAQPDGKILVGGRFSTFNGQAANCVVRLNPNGSIDPSFSVGAGFTFSTSYSEVYALAVQADGKILVGGRFNSFNGQTVSGLVRLNPNGSLDASFSPPLTGTNYVYALDVQPDGNILISGALTVNGTYSSTLARLLPSGAPDPGFALSPAIDGRVYSSYTEAPMVRQADGKILVIGNFDLPGYRRVARLNADGSLDVTFQAPAGPNDVPATLGVQPNGSIVVGGNFTGVGNTETTLVRLAGSGALDASFAPQLQAAATVTTLARQADGSLLAGGNFTEWEGTPVHRLVRLSANGALDAAYAASSQLLNGTVSRLLVQDDGKALVGTTRSLYRVLPGGPPDLGFTFFFPTTASIAALAQQADGKLLVTGSFTGPGYQFMARLYDNGSLDNTFVRASSQLPGTPQVPTALLVQTDGRILVGTNFNNNPTAYLLRYEPSGAVDASFTVPAFGYSSTARLASLVQQPDGKLLVGGTFSDVNGTDQTRLARLNATGSLDTSFAPGFQFGPGNISVLALQPNGRVLVGGSFQATGTAGIYANLARVLPTGQLDATFAPTGARPNGSINGLLVQPDGTILLQGGFTTINGQLRLNLARITAPNVLAVQAPAVAAATTAWPVPTHERLHVQPAATAHPRQAELLDALGRVVQQRILPGAAEFSLDVSGLPAGLYVLRLHYQEGTVSRPISVE